MATWNDVVRIVGGLPLAAQQSSHDWRVGEKLLAWERPLRKSDREALSAQGLEPPDGDILGVRVSDERARPS